MRVGDAKGVYSRLLSQGVIVRPIAGYGMPEHLRVTVGLPAHNTRFLEALESAGFRVNEVRTNDYDFISERALDACSTYGVESISLAAAREM